MSEQEDREELVDVGEAEGRAHEWFCDCAACKVEHQVRSETFHQRLAESGERAVRRAVVGESRIEESAGWGASGDDEVGALPWRVGRSVGRTIYDAHERLIGVMDTPELAAAVVAGVNAHGVGVEMGEEAWPG